MHVWTSSSGGLKEATNQSRWPTGLSLEGTFECKKYLQSTTISTSSFPEGERQISDPSVFCFKMLTHVHVLHKEMDFEPIKSSFILKPPYRPFLAKRNFTNSMLKFSGDTLTHFLATGKYSIIFNLCSPLLVYSNMRVVKLCAVNSTVAHIQVQWSCPCP